MRLRERGPGVETGRLDGAADQPVPQLDGGLLATLQQMPTSSRSSSVISGRFTTPGNAPLANSTGARASIMGTLSRKRSR